MKIVIAPDSFKGSLSSLQVSQAIEDGLKKVIPTAEYIKIPMADGGEGTMQALTDASHGKIFSALVHNPLGKKVTAHWSLLGDHDTAVIEIAQAAGIQYVNQTTANPLITTTYGVGELIKEALDHHAKKLIIGLGGSCTNDAGVGMLQALGAKFLDKNGTNISAGGGELGKIAKINVSQLDPRLAQTQIILASDVTNPLTGTNGASYVFAPQKGADSAMVKVLDNNLHHFASLTKDQLDRDFENYPGAGAAGGLGFAFLAFLKTTLKPGVDVILQYTHFREKTAKADYVFTGEGATDFQTKFGKTPYGIAKAAKEIAPQAKVICLTGNIGKDIDTLYDAIDAIFATESGAKSLDQAINDSVNDISLLSENIGRLLI